MYRRKLESLPPDFSFPSDLKGLGYFINEEDQIRMISDPELPFHYHASKNERFLERHKQAMNECIFDIVMRRLGKLGMFVGRLPFGTPDDEPHVPILASRNLTRAERVIVYFGEPQELGTFSGRIISLEKINLGSAVNFVRDALEVPPVEEGGDGDKKDRENMPVLQSKVGVALANPGQLVWYRRGSKAVSFEAWNAIPRKYAVFESMPMTELNNIPRNGNESEHMECMFEDVLRPLVKRRIKIDIIINHNVDHLVTFLDRNWTEWKDGIAAVACASANVYPLDINNEDFLDFWGKRARMYILSKEPLGTPMTGRQLTRCNVYSSGVAEFAESIMPRSYKEFLNYFKLVNRDAGYVNVPQDIPGEAPEQEDIGWGTRPGDADIDSEDEVIDVEV